MTDVGLQIEFGIARLPERLPGGSVGLVVRHEESPRSYWLLALAAGDVTLPRVLDCLALLILDEELRLLPRVLFPYAPPRAALRDDGLFLDVFGEPLSRQLLSFVRVVRVPLRARAMAYIENLTRQLTGDEILDDFRPLPSGHVLHNPQVPDAWLAPLPPIARYQNHRNP